MAMAAMASCSPTSSLLPTRPSSPLPPSHCSTSYLPCPAFVQNFKRSQPLQYSRSRSSCSPRSMAPEDEKMTRRSPLDFPIEWERPRPGRRPDIFPQFSPMKTPLPQPPPTDPPEQDEDEEQKEEEEKPEEEPDKPQE